MCTDLSVSAVLLKAEQAGLAVGTRASVDMEVGVDNKLAKLAKHSLPHVHDKTESPPPPTPPPPPGGWGV